VNKQEHRLYVLFDLTKPMKYAILAPDNIGDSHPHREVSEKRGYPKRQEGQIKTFRSKDRICCQDYVLTNPFFQNRKNGFLFFRQKIGAAYG